MPDRIPQLDDLAAPLAGHAVRNDEREWVPLLPGITIKTLLKDAANGAQTTLWRLQPGACVPPHPHSRDEECLILEGSIVLDEIEYFRNGGILQYVLRQLAA